MQSQKVGEAVGGRLRAVDPASLQTLRAADLIAAWTSYHRGSTGRNFRCVVVAMAVI
jgi:hypothetical protein